MRQLLAFIFLLTGFPALAGNFTFTFEDPDTTPETNRVMLLYPIGGPFTNNAGGIVTRDRLSGTTDTSGSVTLSNIYGWSYRSELLGRYGVTTNYYVFPVTNATLNAADYSGIPTNSAGLAYSAAQSDSNYVAKSGSTMTGALVNNSSGGFQGNGGGLTNLNSTKIVGMIPSQNVATQTFAIPGPLITTNSSGGIGLSYNGSALTNIQATNLTGTFNTLNWLTNSPNRSVSVLAFGAVCDGELLTNVTTTAGSATMTVIGGTPSTVALTTADVGKQISIYGAGSGGQNLLTTIAGVSGGTVTLGTTAVTSVANYSAVYGHDDTAAFQLALNTMAINGGRIVVPNGIEVGKAYRIMCLAGPLQDTGTNASHHNAQVYLPALPVKPLVPELVIEGANTPWYGGTAGNSLKAFAVYGPTIWSLLPSGPDVNPGRVLDCRNFATPGAAGYCTSIAETVPLNNLNITVRNLSWRVAADNNLTALDLQGVQGSRIENVYIDTGWYGGFIPGLYTKTNTWGLKTAGSFNSNLGYVNNCYLNGFYNLIDVGENASIPFVLLIGGVNAICKSPLSGGAGAWIGQANVQECSNIVWASSLSCASVVNIEKLNVYSYSNFVSTLNLICDPANALFGSLTYSYNGANNNYSAATNIPLTLPIVGNNAYINQMVVNKEIISTYAANMHESTEIFDKQASLYFKRIYAFGDNGPSINFGTQDVRFATTPLWKTYVSGNSDSFNIEHTRIGSTPFQIAADDTVYIGRSGGPEPILPSVPSSSILRTSVGGSVDSATIGNGLTWDGFTLKTSEVIVSNALSAWPATPSARGAAAVVNSNGYTYILLSTNGATGSATWTATNKLGW